MNFFPLISKFTTIGESVVIFESLKMLYSPLHQKNQLCILYLSFYFFSFDIIHLNVDVAGSKLSNSTLVQLVRKRIVINKISPLFIYFSFRVTYPTLVYLTIISKIYWRITHSYCRGNYHKSFLLNYLFLLLPLDFFFLETLRVGCL